MYLKLIVMFSVMVKNNIILNIRKSVYGLCGGGEERRVTTIRARFMGNQCFV